ncbi:lysozyme inhibitor LprI family protein [Flavobacterium sp. DG1-102-2]|uniref:lysozyme inhibitor LprI family protein n=1 Tax=Flavobacterium sp. DG1-102-2 TaxID=3081663 RepID=UPI0029494435|nr:lysozyme inhibitor LprI family protein [Flavobacterium sp. DG1-102-2]MDV6168788.1 lysozyme inhibitor LprI family protein [Flavobacterium sp. DG1-102-2]
MIKQYLFLFLMLFCCSVMFAQAGPGSNPIDDALRECRADKENQNPEGSIQCEYAARIAWEKEVEKHYKKLLEILTADEKKGLRISQKDWLNYRDNEMLFASTFYKNMKSDSWLVIQAVRLTSIQRTRALELQEYYDMKMLDQD